jgi:phosphatidylserine/phosphatidylglycerophosphate/cardiolipin synthase-like enzyme
MFRTKLILLIIFVTLIISGQANAEVFKIAKVDYQVCFTPGGDCTEDIVGVIDKAKKQILVQAYSFTSAPIAKALVAAHKQGVDVKVILDKSQKTQKYSSSTFLINQGIPAWIDYRPAIAHNKVMIIDDKTVITGSFNFTKAAQDKNAENLIILVNADIAKQYSDNWHRRQAKSEAAESYVPKNQKSRRRENKE